MFEITQAMFENRDVLEYKVPTVRSMQELGGGTSSGYRVHEGAKKYFRRHDSNFLVTYAEVIALVLSVCVAIIGALVALKQWLDRRSKNRIDQYYVKVNDLMVSAEAGVAVETLRSELFILQQGAFEELINERLHADSSFVIFQGLVQQSLDKLKELE